MITTLLAVLALMTTPCPLSGTAKGAPIKAANVLKNRTAIPGDAEIDTAFTVKRLLKLGDDLNPHRWNENKAGELNAYVFNVKAGGIETVNCGAKAIAARDTHIELVASLSDTAKSRRIIVEVTPRIRAWAKTQGFDWSTPTLTKTIKGKHVLITGWAFADYEHAPNAENTHPHNKLNWRATVWELHPVTAIKIIR